MKDRLVLAGLIILLWLLLIIFQKYTPVQSSIFIVLGFMAGYAFLLQIAQFHQKRKTKKALPKLNKDYEPFVSILIPAHNEENVIENTILNIFLLDYYKYEILVIDDRSTDNTALILERLSKKYPEKIKFHVRQKNAFPGKSAVLNEAFEMSKGEVICVFDADAKINSDFFKKILPYLLDPCTGAVQSRKVISNRSFNLLTRCQDNEYALDSHFQAGRDSIRGAVELRGNGELIKREALIDVRGWNNFTITDDLDLSTRLHLKNWDVRFCSDVEVYEEGVTGFIPLLKQRRRWVEGSIRRYLDYFTEVLFSKDISLRVSLDMWAYISEFVLPVWLISEWTIQGIKFIKGFNDNILSSLAVIPAICVFFISGLIYGLKKYKKLSLSQAILQAVETGFYMIIVWTPVVLFIVFKIIFMKRTMDWGKTLHGEDDSVKLTEKFND
ncbi:MAG: glycosyltransferase family 2 protein [bacterium]